MLLTAHNAADLGLHQVLLCEATRRVVRSAVKHLRLGANRHLGAAIHGLAILTSASVLAICHFVF